MTATKTLTFTAENHVTIAQCLAHHIVAYEEGLKSGKYTEDDVNWLLPRLREAYEALELDDLQHRRLLAWAKRQLLLKQEREAKRT